MIDRNVPIPYYYQLEQHLRQQIGSGYWKAGERFPTEMELCQQYELSRTTVREAMGHLEDDGLIFRRKGVGTFVNNPG